MADCTGTAVPLLKLTATKERCVKAFSEPLTTPDGVAKFVRKAFPCAAQEHFVAIFLDAKNSVLGAQEVSRGGLASTSVDPKVLFAGALLVGATGLIVSHNHPSDNAEPSQQDDAMTDLLVRAARYLSIAIVDHIIVGPTKDYSYREHGRLR